MQELKAYDLMEVAGILKVTRRTVYNMISKKKLPAIKIGKEWRVRHEDLDNLLKGKTSN